MPLNDFLADVASHPHISLKTLVFIGAEACDPFSKKGHTKGHINPHMLPQADFLGTAL